MNQVLLTDQGATEDVNRWLQQSEEKNRESGDVASGVVFFCALTALFLWCCGPTILGWVRGCCLQMPRNRTRQTQAQARQEALESAIDSMIRSADEADRARSVLLGVLGSEGQNFESVREEHRRAYINRVLTTKTYVADSPSNDKSQGGEASQGLDLSADNLSYEGGGSTDDKHGENSVGHADDANVARVEEESSVDIREEGNIGMAALAGSTDDGDDVEGCVICLNPYVDGDEVAWSQNELCPHKFHRQCIVEWLVKHDNCPICRNYFLLFSEEDAVPAVRREFLSEVDDDGDLESVPAQLLRGLEIFYRARAPLPSPAPSVELVAPESSRRSTAASAATAGAVDSREAETERQSVDSEP